MSCGCIIVKMVVKGGKCASRQITICVRCFTIPIITRFHSNTTTTHRSVLKLVILILLGTLYYHRLHIGGLPMSCGCIIVKMVVKGGKCASRQITICVRSSTIPIITRFHSNTSTTHPSVLKLVILILLGALYCHRLHIGSYTYPGHLWWQGEC